MICRSIPALWLAVAVMVTFAAAPPGALAGPPIEDYTLFAENGMTIGAGSVIDGLVGARNNGANGFAIRLNGGGTTVSGDARSGGDVNLQNNAHVVGTVIHAPGTTLTLGITNATVGGEVVANPELPALPPATVFPCPVPQAQGPFSGANGQALALPAGSYSSVAFGSHFTLTLTTAGDYYFDSITAGSGAKLIVSAPPVKIFVCDKVKFSGSVDVLPDTLSSTDVTVEVHGVGHEAFRAGGGSNWIGDVFAPFGQVHFGGGGCCSSFAGRFVADSIDIEHAVFGGGGGSCCTPGDFPPKDATLLHGAKNQNNGANETLRVGYQIVTLVGFDVTGYQGTFSQVTSARLILSVCSDPIVCPGSPSQWPVAGGKVYAYRLDTGFENWVEGTGINFGPGAVAGNTGQGVTWNCPTDADISNLTQECIGVPTVSWGLSGGTNFQGPASPPVLHLNSFTDGFEVAFDVTADVKAGLAPDTTYMSWFIRKPTGGGFVEYYSREGAAAQGNLNLAPKLAITP